MALVDRETERRELEGLARRSGAHLAILYGRRRIGKTFLLRQLWGDLETFYYLASDTTPEINRRELVEEWTNHLSEVRGEEHPALEPEDLATWRVVFRELLRTSGDGPFVVILDEFQYLLGDEDDIRSQLVAVWDRLEPSRPLLVVLCGSAVRTMRELDDAQAPLYGRIDWKHQLEGFDYLDASEMAPFDEPRQLARTYGVFGGTPDYLASLEPDESFRENVARAAMSPRGHVRHGVDSVIEQERGLRNISQYRSILTAIARGRTEISEISDVTGMDAGTPLRRKVKKLEALELIEGRKNFGASRTSPYRYRLSDPALMFHYAVVDPLRNELETVDPLEIWDDLVASRLRTHMGHVFETIVEQAYLRLRGPRDLPTVSEWSYWQGVDRNQHSIEIDVVARLSDKSMLTGSIKWNRSPVGPQVYTDHTRNLQRLADSGYAWAHDALQDSATMLFVAAGGFGPAFDQLAQSAEQNILQWELADLYGE